MVSSPQKLATPTFQVPFWSTAVPVWFFSSGVPPTRMSYFTVACVAEFTVTFLTLAVARAARLEPDWLLMTEANCAPFCRSATRLLSEVLALKKASQIAVIAVAAPPLRLRFADAVAYVGAAVVVAEDLPAGADKPAELGLPLPL